jgi:hypothetical protein
LVVVCQLICRTLLAVRLTGLLYHVGGCRRTIGGRNEMRRMW